MQVIAITTQWILASHKHHAKAKTGAIDPRLCFLADISRRFIVDIEQVSCAMMVSQEALHSMAVSNLIYGVTLRRHSRALLAGLHELYQQRVSTVI